MMHQLIRRALGATTIMLVLTASNAKPQDGQPPAEVRSVLEGTWQLIEWHVGDIVLRPPDMEGRWMVYDGVVMATRHRDGPGDDFESTAGYGAYRWGPTQWIYGYERSEDLRGPSPEDAELRITGSNPIRMTTHEITREGDMLILDSEVLRWEYDIPDRTFVLKINGETIRKYRKIP
jgi:hypothetical protein